MLHAIKMCVQTNFDSQFNYLADSTNLELKKKKQSQNERDHTLCVLQRYLLSMHVLNTGRWIYWFAL